jgi:DNA-binding NarL/FixJ family response regulator
VQGHATQNAVVLHKYPLWRDALTEMIQTLGFRVVGTTDSADEALALAHRENAALLVAGIAPGRGQRDGIECVRSARAEIAGLKAVVLTPSYDEGEAERALAAGAYAYVVESTHPDDIRAAIRQGFNASVFLSIGEPSSPPQPPTRRADHEALTKRELEILRLVSEGQSNADVARKLWVTEQTVKFHLSNIYRKLRVANRTEAARWAQLTGLLEDRPTHESASG